MANNGPVLAEELRSRIIGGIRVGEGTGVEIVNLDGDLKLLVGRNVLSRLREEDDGGNHPLVRGDLAHNYVRVSQVLMTFEIRLYIPIPLQDPPLCCRPLVVAPFPAQKLTKLAGSVNEATRPS